MSDQNDIRIDIVGSVEGLKPATAEAGRELDKVNDAAGKTGGALSDLGRDAAKEAAEGLGMSSRAATVASNAIGALRTPVAVAVTALAALAAGWIKGAKEEQEFSRSLILSNNAIGSSVDQLRALAMESSSATRSQSALSDALAKLAATGEVSTNGLSSAARVATDLARLGVQSVSETVGQFERLGREPVAAILRLNDQYRFLTASVFQQIQALDTEGRREEAAALAQRTYSAAMEERTQKLGASLGSLERMWKGVGDAARQAWDMMLAVGRTRSLQSRIDELRQKAAPGRGIFSGLSDSEKSELSRLESQLAYEQRIAQAAGDRAKKEEAALAWLREGEEYLDKQARLARELAKIDALGEQAGVSKAEIAARKEAARAKYADKTSISEAAALLKEQYANRLATIKESLAAEDGLLRIARARGELDERAYLDRLGEAQRESFAARAAVLREQLATATKPADRERILGDIQKLGAEAAAAANASTLAYVELDKAARATLATLTSEAWGEVGQLATDNAALREELVTLGMTTQQLDEYRRQKTLAAQESANDFADALEEAAAAIDSEGEAAQRAKQYYLDLATARRAAAEQFGERATLERQLATSREALRLATESAKVWQEGWQETDRIARDAFVAWADDGASAAERIGQSLRAALLSAIYEATLRPIALQVYTTAAGALGLSGGAAGAGAGSNLLGMASNAKSLYDLASGDYGLYGSFATSQYGQALGLSTAGVTASSIGTGASLGYGGLFANGATAGSTSGVASMSTLGSALPWAAGGGILAGVLYGGKGQSAAGGAIGAGVGYATAAGSAWASGAAMGSWAGPIGALAGAVIGGFLGSRIGGGERFKSTYGSASGAFDDGRYTSTGAWQGGRQFGDDVDQVLDRATQAFSARLGSLYDAFGLDDQIAAQASVRLRRTSGRLASGFEADLDGDGPQGLTTLVSAQYGGDGEVEGALADFVTAILTKGIKAAVEKSDLPEIVKQLYAPLTETADIEAATVTILAAQQILTSAGTTMTEFLGSTAESYLRGEENLIGMLDRTVTALAAVNPVLEDLGLASIEFTLAGGDMASQLAALSGGVDAFVGKASAYYEAFYSEEERVGRLADRLADQFEALGYAMPTTRSGFRELIDGLGEIDDSTAGTFAALMDLVPAFASVATAAENQAQGFARAQAAAAAARDERMISENQAYEARYSALQDEYNALRGISRAAADAASYIHSGEKALYRLITTLDGAINQAEAAVRATDSAYADVQRVVRDAQGVNKSLQAVASDTIKTVGALADYLSGAIRDLYADAQSTADQSARHGLAYVKQAAEAAVSTGYLPDTDGLREAVDAARAGISDDGLSRYEQDYRRLVLAGYLSQIESVAEPQVSFAEQQLSAAEASNEWLQQILDSVQRQYELFRDGALNGTSVLSLPDTIERLEQAMQSETLAQLRVEGLRRLDPANPDWYAQLSPGMAGRDLSAILALEAILQSGALDHPKADEAIANLNNFYINPLSPVYRVGLPTQDQEAMLKALQQMNDRLAAIEQHSRKTATAVNGNPDQPLPTAIYEDAT